MTLNFNKIYAVVMVYVHAEYHQHTEMTYNTRP